MDNDSDSDSDSDDSGKFYFCSNACLDSEEEKPKKNVGQPGQM